MTDRINILLWDNIIMLIAIIGETFLISKPLDMVLKRIGVQGGNVLHGAMLGLLYGAAEKAELQ